MKPAKILLLALIHGTVAYADPLTTSFKGSCLVRSRILKQTLSDFDLTVDPKNLFITQEMRFTVPVENGHDFDLIDFVARAQMERPDAGRNATILKISSPDHTNEAVMADAQPGTVLRSRYYIRGGRIDCTGIVN